MLKNNLLSIFLLTSLSLFSQIEGTITDTENNNLPYVNIYTEDGRYGTTTNENGKYELKLKKKGEHKLIFQFLGFKTKTKTIEVDEFPHKLNLSLSPETTSLEQVTINPDENPANTIIRNTIAARKKNANKIKAYTANFYSRGLWRIKNAPEKILGQKVGDLGGGLDSTRSGIVYLSETVSKISYKQPDDFKEDIIASKVSGDDNGFSLNSAQEAYFTFYENTVEINSELVSPISDYAFNYYNFRLDGTFYDDHNRLINKIEVSPKRKNDRIFSGYIYIVEDLWQIFGVELQTTGQAIQVPPIETLDFKQNYRYSEKKELYVQISQSVDFNFSMFGISGDGRFTAVYSNYNFKPKFDQSRFGAEVLTFKEAANKKDSAYWQEIRPVPLTDEEIKDYVKKDSIQELRNSRPYLDSIDREHNNFRSGDVLFGYSHQNSFKHRNFSISSPLFGTHFNTVQGWNTALNISYKQNKNKNPNEKYWQVFSDLEYGFSEERFRIVGGFQKKFNNISRPVLSLKAGSETRQFNASEPISERINDFSTLLFERNYMKIYERNFAEIAYRQELTNGLFFSGNLSYQKRNPLENNSGLKWVDRDALAYSSNNPKSPDITGLESFDQHNIFKAEALFQIRFGQKYMSYPDGKFNIRESKYPILFFGYEKGFGASKNQYNFDHFKARVHQDLKLGNKGKFAYNLRGGIFLNAEEIAFTDYRHFNGNQTRIGNGFSYLNRFNLLPYYTMSTNTTYTEVHAEHNFKGWILGKIPFLNQLNYNLVLGGHALYTKNNKPYSEYSVGIDNLGFGKYRLLRLDYVISNQDGRQNGAFIFGLKFLGIFE